MTTLDKFAPAKAVFYFRTLDRWPGGNADMITVKVTMRLSPAPAPGLDAQFYSCFDGRHTWYPARRVALDPGDALAAFLDVARSLAARGRSTLVVSPFDPAEDEWDTEWAESEIHLYATDDDPETPDNALLRLVRRTTKVKASAPDPELMRAFELGHQLTGVGRVFQFANTQDALSAAYRSQDGPTARPLDYVAEAAPTYLPPATDAGFLKKQDQAAKKRAKSQAAKASRREKMLVYRLDEVPELLTRELPPDASPRQCLFFTARDKSRAVSEMLKAIPEAEHAEVDAAMDIADKITRIVSMSPDLARTLRPDEVPAGGEILGGAYCDGFHGGDAGEVERWFDAHGVERVSLRTFLDKLILLRVHGEEGEALERVDKLAGGPPAWTVNSIGGGLYAFERDEDHVRFQLACVDDDNDDVPWLELRSSDLPPGEVHTVTVPAARAATKAPAKKAPAKQAPAKKAASKQNVSAKTAAKKVASKKVASKKAASKKAPSKQTPAKKTPAKKAASKRPPSK